jgi:hypothetical protein
MQEYKVLKHYSCAEIYKVEAESEEEARAIIEFDTESEIEPINCYWEFNHYETGEWDL